MRKLRIYTDCGEKPNQPVNVALQTVLTVLLAEAEVVADFQEADLIIIDKVKKLAEKYREDKQYVLLDYGQPAEISLPDLPNFVKVDISDCLVELLQISSRIKLEKETEVAISVVESAVSAEKPGLPWILVVDDKPENQQAAKNQLGNFNLVVAEGFDQARLALRERQFAYALLDLHLPVATGGALGEAGIAKHIGLDIPYGLFLLLEACQHGAHAAVVTDLNHHQDPFSAAFDYYANEAMIINGKKALLLHAQLTTGGVKDWCWALDRLMN
ncbi:MAG TPA: hypothetical protein PK896_03855 [bacterium]|nr:hypothetical protein [bacterium]